MPTAFLKRHNSQLTRKWHHLLVALGGAFVVLLLASSHWQATASLKALGDLQQQAVRVEHLDSLLIQLMDAESAVRAYLLSANRVHLEPYDKSQATIGSTLEDIHHDLGALSSNDEALADLSGLVAIKLRSLDQAVERGLAGEETRIQGKRYTDRIRERILGLKAGLAAEAQDSFERSTRHVERTRWVLAIQAGAALALLVVLFFVVERQFKLREQMAALLHSENQRLDALVQERTDELSDLASYLTNARESEKARLARELHDELGALLTAAKMELGWIARQFKGSAEEAWRERLARLESLLDSGIALKRRIIDGLRPPLLEELGLVNALRILGEEFSEGECNPELQLELPTEDLMLAPATSLAVFRIAQEALTNIRKHAGARTVKLAMRVKEGCLELALEDDGKGFQTGWERGRHHGLAGMKHRVLMCAGNFSLTSQPGNGTQLRVSIPFPGTAMPASDQAPQGDACRT